MTVLSATAWTTNAHLIGTVHALGYLRDEDHVLDPTFGRGGWWKRWRPEKLTALVRSEDGTDFRCLPYPDGSFDAIAYDPPYVARGGIATSTVPDMHDRYGMAEGGAEDPMFRNPEELQAIIDAGLGEMFRLVRPSLRKKMGDGPNGIVLVKCKNYVSGGVLWPGVHRTLAEAEELGFVLWDEFTHLAKSGGPQPQNRSRAVTRKGIVERVPTEQQHAVQNHSTLLVLRRLP